MLPIFPSDHLTLFPNPRLTKLFQYIFFSDLRKDFVTPPYTQQIQLGSQAQLRCHPPKGNPAARVIHWAKNGVEIDPASQTNFIQSADGHLIIIQAKMENAGNYTCVASNDVLTRRSPSATITIYGKQIQS